MKQKSQDCRVRSLAQRRGYKVRKSRKWKYVPNLDNHGEYMLIDLDNGFPILGFHYDASLDDIEAFLKD